METGGEGNDMKPLLELRRIHKSFAAKRVLEELSLQIQEGEIVGLLGANGSGKTTLFKVISGLIQSYSGEILYNNTIQPTGVGELPDVHVAFDSQWMFPLLQEKHVYTLFSFFLPELNHNSADEQRRRHIYTVSTQEGSRVGTYSHGMKQKVLLNTIAMNSGSKGLYILDEPTNGLDYEGILTVTDWMMAQKSENRSSFFISTHYLEIMDKIADRVLVLENGTIRAQLTPGPERLSLMKGYYRHKHGASPK